MVSELQLKHASSMPDKVQGCQSNPIKNLTKPVVPAVKTEISIDSEQLRRNLEIAIDRINLQIRDGGRNVQFSIDPQSKVLIVKVTKADTGEVIRQIPSESVLRVGHSIGALKGLLHNEIT